MRLDELKELVASDAEMSAETLDYIDELLAAVEQRDPTVHDLAAFGAYLQNIYNGIENVLKRFAMFHQVEVPNDANWHETLLQLFTHPAKPPLPQLIPPDLSEQLTAYRGFRHVFTKRYAAQLDWEKLEPLVKGARPLLEAFQSQVDAALGRTTD
ncbi:MAG: hypothetical protein QOF78_3323 [Phycisphaerales bacterium]|jgi:hypothetical protein|nr:hypothetical protein [Phycisphaerales bacterium]